MHNVEGPFVLMLASCILATSHLHKTQMLTNTGVCAHIMCMPLILMCMSFGTN